MVGDFAANLARAAGGSPHFDSGRRTDSITSAKVVAQTTHIRPIVMRAYYSATLGDSNPLCAEEYGERFGALKMNGLEAECRQVLTPPTFLVILMTMFETRSVADVKAHLSELVAQVGTQHDRVTVTVHGRPTAVLVAVEDLESLEETIAVLSDADVVRALATADAELAAGGGESEATLRAAMAARRR